jgi:ArsR family transcriptional regulator
MNEKAFNIFFETLGNRNRLRIIRHLNKRPMSVNEISKSLQLDQTTISHNLRRLYITGFVNFRKNGKNKVYYTNKKIVRPLLNLVDTHIRCNCSELCKCNKKELVEKLRR